MDLRLLHPVLGLVDSNAEATHRPVVDPPVEREVNEGRNWVTTVEASGKFK